MVCLEDLAEGLLDGEREASMWPTPLIWDYQTTQDTGALRLQFLDSRGILSNWAALARQPAKLAYNLTRTPRVK
jgi:hypothetical protein